MKILHTVESYYPSIGGMPEVVRQLSERLVKQGHEVTVATSFNSDRNYQYMNGVKIIQFKIHGNIVFGMKGEIDNYIEFVQNGDFDIVTNFAAQQWATDALLPSLNKIKAAKVFVPTGFSSLYANEYKQYFNKMKTWMKNYDMNVFLSDDYRDINFSRENGITKCLIIPNGAGENEFLNHTEIDIKKMFDLPQESFLILLVGSHTGLKGHREAIEIFERANIKNASLLIIGNYIADENHGKGLKQLMKKFIKKLFIKSQNNCPDYCLNAQKIWNNNINNSIEGKKLVIKDLDRIHTVAAYQQADLFLFPSKIECSPIVLFEAAAGKTPFLSSDVGNAKEIVEWTGSGWILPTTKNSKGYSTVNIASSAEMLEVLYYDQEKRIQMAENGYHAWKKRFSWEKIMEQYENLYKSLLR